MITHVAVRHNGKVYSLPKPNRHHSVIWMIWEMTGEEVHSHGDDQGFLDEAGRYYKRTEALCHAQANNQLKEGVIIRCNMLFSEDVW